MIKKLDMQQVKKELDKMFDSYVPEVKKQSINVPTNDVVEQIARMNQQQRDEFVHDFVTTWPQLAYDIKEAIQIEIFEQRKQKEQQELEAYSQKYAQYNDEPLVLTKDMEVK